VQSRLHRGSTFTVSLPIAPDSLVADERSNTAAQAASEPQAHAVGD
jgi:hypothetical protein